jgi:hypothetical protein
MDNNEAQQALEATPQPFLCLAKATLYFQGGFGLKIHKVEVRDLVIELKRYAQYQRAVIATFVPKGKRNKRELVQERCPSLIVLEGWGHALEPDGMYDPARTTRRGAVTAHVGRYSACDPRWVGDFAERLRSYSEETSTKPAANFIGFDTQAR